MPNLKKFAQGVPEVSQSREWVERTREWDEREVTVTFDHQNLINASLNPGGGLGQIWRKSLQAPVWRHKTTSHAWGCCISAFKEVHGSWIRGIRNYYHFFKCIVCIWSVIYRNELNAYSRSVVPKVPKGLQHKDMNI